MWCTRYVRVSSTSILRRVCWLRLRCTPSLTRSCWVYVWIWMQAPHVSVGTSSFFFFFFSVTSIYEVYRYSYYTRSMIAVWYGGICHTVSILCGLWLGTYNGTNALSNWLNKWRQRSTTNDYYMVNEWMMMGEAGCLIFLIYILFFLEEYEYNNNNNAMHIDGRRQLIHLLRRWIKRSTCCIDYCNGNLVCRF